jgi:hypothetical protein
MGAEMIQKIYQLTMTVTALAALCLFAFVGYQVGGVVERLTTGVERVVSSVEQVKDKFSSVVDRFEKRKLFSPEVEEEL